MFFWWKTRSGALPFKYVYINQDGSARECSNGEREYLSQNFHPADGARPYIKSSYRKRDGWGSQSGFLLRRKVPRRIKIAPVNPKFDELDDGDAYDLFEEARAVGDTVEKRAGGSTLIMPNPNVSKEERFKRIKAYHLDRQRQREALAKGV